MPITLPSQAHEPPVPDPPRPIGLVGLGGYAGGLIEVIRSAAPAVCLAAACDGDLDQHPERVQSLREAGVAVFPSFDHILKAHADREVRLDAVWLPIPIHLHREFTVRSLAAGLSVLVEKPAAGCVADIDAMIAARDRSRKSVLVGFQDLFFPEVHEAKRRLLDGAIGEVRDVAIYAAWPRGEGYFNRNAWAGKLRHGERWVRDSPLNNALAHPVHTALFMLGENTRDIASVAEVRAELYRVNDIESFDTCFVRAHTASDIRITIAFSHAVERNVDPITIFRGSRGTLEATLETLRFSDGHRGLESRAIQRDYGTLPRALANACGGSDVSAATLETAREHTRLIEMVHENSRIMSLKPSSYRVNRSGGQALRFVPSLEALLATCAVQHTLPSESQHGAKTFA
ncbi:MAG: Gfo/Idh/MocA family oxidoreductase [Planctomycetota bacterium]